MIADGISWFPQQYAALFILAKGLLAMVSTIMLLIHMNLTWDRISANATGWGQRLRYLSLLGFSILVTGATAEQLAENSLVGYRHLGSLSVIVFLIVAMSFSLKEDYEQRHHPK
jgi:cellobiose-specific phosphotransferase system component IIC